MTEKLTQIAMVLAEVQRIRKGAPYPHWEDLPQAEKDELVAFVTGILSGRPVAQQHEAWLADQIADGWKWGAVKNAATKEDPDLVHWEDYDQARRDELQSASRFVLAVASID